MAAVTFGYLLYRVGEWDGRKRLTGFATVHDAAQAAQEALGADRSFTEYLTFRVGSEPDAEPDPPVTSE